MLQGSQYNMLEFAKKYFREAQKKTTQVQDDQTKSSGESFKQSSKKGRESRDPEEMLKFTKNPIQESLIEFSDGGMNRIAAQVFQGATQAESTNTDNITLFKCLYFAIIF
ncbi:hypothetical protein FKM82_002851 [Ascaphus truei]